MSIVLRHTLLITIGNCISKILGLIRDASIAWLLGNTLAADALATALRIPFLFRRLLGEGSLSIGLIRVCQNETIHHNTGVQTTLYITHIITLGLFIFILPLIFIPQLALTLLAPGFHHKDLLSHETLYLFRICIPYILFATLAAGGIAILYTKKYFLLPSLSPTVFNCTILTGGFFAIGHSPTTISIILAYSILIGGLFQWILQIPTITKLKRSEPILLKNNVKVKKLLSHVPINILTSSVPQLAFIFASTLTSFLPTGYVSSLFYAERIIEFPIGIFGSALGIVILPKLIQLHHNQDFSSISKEISQQISFCCCVYLPAAAGLISIANPLIQTIFYHGSFSSQATQITALALCAYAPGLPATALSRILISCNYAFNQHRKPFFSALIALTTSIVSGLILIYPLGILGPPLGVSFGLWTYCFLLWKNLKTFINVSFSIKTFIIQLFATVVNFILSFTLIKLLPIKNLIVLLITVIPISIASYGILLWLIDKKQIQELFSFIKHDVLKTSK